MTPFLALLLLLAEQAGAAASPDLPSPPYQLVFLDGHRLPLVEAPRWGFGQASVKVAGGKRVQVQWRHVDHEATHEANPELQAPGPAKVWTEADLVRIRGERLNVTGASAGYEPGPGGEPGSVGGRTLAKKGKAGEAEWRARATPVREEIARLEATLDYLDRARENWEAFTLGTGDYQRAAAQELGKIRRAEQAAERQLQQARGHWAQIEEEARTSGALPGWLR